MDLRTGIEDVNGNDSSDEDDFITFEHVASDTASATEHMICDDLASDIVSDENPLSRITLAMTSVHMFNKVRRYSIGNEDRYNTDLSDKAREHRRISDETLAAFGIKS